MLKQHEEPFQQIMNKFVAEGKLERFVRKGEVHYRMTKLSIDNFVKEKADERKEKTKT